MIRLIASDLDGTLLDENGQLPDGIFDVIRALKEKGILFAAASGRQYANLKRLFFPVHDQMNFICENGTLNVVSGKTEAKFLPRAVAEEIIRDIQSAGMELLASTKDTVLLCSGSSPDYIWDMLYRLRNTCAVVDDPLLYADGYIKVSGFQKGGLTDSALKIQKKWRHTVHADIAGKEWLDLTLSSKGDGLKNLSRKTGIPLSDVMAFGDQFNDESMLSIVGHPYLMTTAPAGMKEKGFTPCDNVMSVLQSLLH